MEQNLNDLNDVEKLLREKRKTRPITKTRNGERRRAREAHDRRETRVERGILMMPTVIVVLICLVLLLEPFFGVQEERLQETEPVTETVTETAAAEPEPEARMEELQDTALTEFFQTYFAARLSADVDTLYAMSGVTNQSEEQRRQFTEQLKTQAGYIEGYENLKLYGVPAVEDDETLVFLSYDVKFRRANTLAPAILYCYMELQPDGSYLLIENRSPEQVQFVNHYTTEHPEVQELINSVNSRLLEAISSDSRLAVIYDAFQTGRIYTEEQDAIDSEVSLISVETEAETAGETEAAETKAATEETRETEAKTQTQTQTQTTEAVVEAVDPGAEVAPGGDTAQTEAAAEAPAEAPAGEVLEIQDNPGA